MWGPLRHLVGLTNDAANADGNVLARLREILNNRLGPVNATGGSATAGSANAKLNALINNLVSSNSGSMPGSVGVNGGGGGRFWVFTASTTWTPPPEANIIRFAVRNGGQGGRPGQQPVSDGGGEGYLLGISEPAAAGSSGTISYHEIRRLRGQTISIVVGSGGTGRVGITTGGGGSAPGMSNGTSGTLSNGNGGSSSVTAATGTGPSHVSGTAVLMNNPAIAVSASPSGAPAAGQPNTAHSPDNTGIGGGAGSMPLPGQSWGGAGANGGSGFVIAWWE